MKQKENTQRTSKLEIWSCSLRRSIRPTDPFPPTEKKEKIQINKIRNEQRNRGSRCCKGILKKKKKSALYSFGKPKIKG